MNTSSDISFWKALNDFRSHRDTIPACLVFSEDGPKCPALVLSYCLFLFFMHLCFWSFSRLRKLKEAHIDTRLALQALATVMVPTCSLWPTRYIELARVRCSHIDIPLEAIIKDTTNGIMELRDPINDLTDLMGSGITVNGHTICINVGWKWWINCIEWWVFAKSNSGTTLGPFDWRHCNASTANSSPLESSLISHALPSSTSYPLLCLDCLPRGVIPPLNAGRKTTLEFTAFSPSLRMLSTAQIFSAIPFIFSKRPLRRPRSLISVLKQLSAAYGSNMAIDSLSNVSADYEHALRHVYKSFSEEQRMRGTYVTLFGIRAWRRKIFLVALEAALVRRGWIERWAIQFTVK